MKHSVFGHGSRPLALLAALASFLASIPAGAQSLSSLMYFNGSRAQGGVVLGSNGYVYGVGSESTIGGGAVAGLLYRVKNDATDIGTVHQYGRLGVYTGGGPRGALTRDSAGNLYGVTAYTAIDETVGLATGNGTVFKVKEDGTYTRLYSFSNYTTTTAPFINTDGANPAGTLYLATDGFLYGTTTAGGANGTGTVFKIATDGSGFVSLHSFGALSGSTNSDQRVKNADGISPSTRLVVANDGYLYGTTTTGGTNGTGVIFKMQRSGAGFQVIKHFDESPDIDTSTGAIKTNVSGGYPGGGLIQGANGSLYGTTNSLGSSGYGTIYRVELDGTAFTILKVLDLTTGVSPLGELIVANDGTLVGTTSGGATQSNGNIGAGTIFSIALDGSNYTNLYVFGVDGAGPGSGVVQDANGAYYGTTTSGAPWGLGSVYKFGAATNNTPQGTPPPFDDGGSMGWMLISALGVILGSRAFIRKRP